MLMYNGHLTFSFLFLFRLVVNPGSAHHCPFAFAICCESLTEDLVLNYKSYRDILYS